jgi:hypothetical protein
MFDAQGMAGPPVHDDTGACASQRQQGTARVLT